MVQAADDVYLALQRELFHEARLLSAADYDGWVSMLADNIKYSMDMPQRRFIEDKSNDRAPKKTPIFDDDMAALKMRIERFKTGFVWAENPINSIRHIISNVEVFETKTDNEFTVYSIMEVHRSRLDAERKRLTAGRKDLWQVSETGYKLVKRTATLDDGVVLDSNMNFFFQENKMGWMDNKVLLITGGASGIGKAVVERFVAEGAKVCVMDRSQDGIDALEAEFNGKVVGLTGDVRSLADNKAAVAKTVEAFGQLDTFIGNAGIWDYMVPLEGQEDDKVEDICDEIFAVNVKGYVLGAKAALPELRKTKGSIVYTASSSSYFTGGGGPIYVASKHAVVGLIKQLAHEVAPDVRVNGVAPGGTLTNLGGSNAAGQADAKLNEIPGVDQMIGSMTPLGFTSKPEDHAGIYLLLASDKNGGYITGSVISSDGGIGLGMRPEQ